MEFLHRHLKIDPSQPNNTHVYAMKRDPGVGLFVPELQSTLYYRKLFEDQIDISTGTLANIDDPTNQFRSGIATFYAISTINGCLSRCAIDAVERIVALKSVRFNAVDQSCFCFDTSFFQWRADGYPNTDVDSLWIRDAGSASQWFETEYCEFVRADTVRARARSKPKPLLTALLTLLSPSPCTQHGRTIVWTKNTSLPGGSGYCLGSPVGGGYILASGSLFESYHEGQSSAVRCPHSPKHSHDCL